MYCRHTPQRRASKAPTATGIFYFQHPFPTQLLCRLYIRIYIYVRRGMDDAWMRSLPLPGVADVSVYACTLLDGRPVGTRSNSRRERRKRKGGNLSAKELYYTSISWI